MARAIVAGFVAIAATPLLPTHAAAQHLPPDSMLQDMLRYLVEDGETPAVALGVLEADGSTSALTYGDAGAGARPLGPGSVFELGEVTMTFTATLLAEMVGRGEVSLDDPISRYLPEGVEVPSLSGYEITFLDLARHRSGLPAEPPEAYDDFTVDDLYELLGDYELDWVPGRHGEFSTLGYGLLGHVLARAAGMSYSALLRERVLEPLGMDRTGFGLEGEIGEWRVAGHEDDEVVPTTISTPALMGGTGLRSSLEDMLAYLAANAGPPRTPLQRAMREAQKVRTGYDPEGEGWGLSWRTYSVARQPLLVTHGGRTDGFTALISFDADRGIGSVLLASTREFNDWTARDLLFGGPPPESWGAGARPVDLDRYVGAYGGRPGRYRATPNNGSRFIRLEDGGFLTYQPRGEVRTRLYPRTDSTFYMVRAPLTVTFQRVGEDMQMIVRIDERDPRLEGRTWRAWRLDTETPPPAVVAGHAGVSATWGTGTWILLGVLGTTAILAILRPLWRGRRRAE